jgi:hypothetical protein
MPGIMALLPRDKLRLYLNTLFHMTAGSRHARLPYHYLGSVTDKLSAVLGKVEIGFNMHLTDKVKMHRYYFDGAVSIELFECRTSDIGQTLGEYPNHYTYLVDSDMTLMSGYSSNSNARTDERVLWNGYGYIIEAFNMKTVGKTAYTVTAESPLGYLEYDEDANIVEQNPYQQETHPVWRGQYLTQSLFVDDTRV